MRAAVLRWPQPARSVFCQLPKDCCTLEHIRRRDENVLYYHMVVIGSLYCLTRRDSDVVLWHALLLDSRQLQVSPGLDLLGYGKGSSVHSLAGNVSSPIRQHNWSKPGRGSGGSKLAILPSRPSTRAAAAAVLPQTKQPRPAAPTSQDMNM